MLKQHKNILIAAAIISGVAGMIVVLYLIVTNQLFGYHLPPKTPIEATAIAEEIPVSLPTAAARAVPIHPVITVSVTIKPSPKWTSPVSPKPSVSATETRWVCEDEKVLTQGFGAVKSCTEMTVPK